MIVENRFLVRIVAEGEGYGRGDKIVHDRRDPLIEFYDTKYADPGEKFGPRGQFVTNYYASTLADHPMSAGLMLDGGVPAWQVSAEHLAPVILLARRISPWWHTLIEGWPVCDECGEHYRDFGVSDHHEMSCSLHPSNTVN